MKKILDFELFNGIPVALEHKIEALPVNIMAKGDYIIKKGKLNNALFLLLAGEAAIYLNEEHEPLKMVYEGETLGEMSLIDHQPATASIICNTNCHIIEISEELMWWLAKNNHDFTMNLLKLVVGRFRGANTQTETSINKQKILEKNSNIDDLTGLLNRGWLNKSFTPLLERCKKEQLPFAYFMIDIDHFKQVNDNYGHLVGDLVLQHTAKILTEIVRAEDYVVRYGGEEIAILLPHTTLENAQSFAERVCKCIEKNIIEYELGKQLNITVSIGISILNKDESDMTLIKYADDALYYAKEHGRNQVKVNTGDL